MKKKPEAKATTRDKAKRGNKRGSIRDLDASRRERTIKGGITSGGFERKGP